MGSSSCFGTLRIGSSPWKKVRQANQNKRKLLQLALVRKMSPFELPLYGRAMLPLALKRGSLSMAADDVRIFDNVVLVGFMATLSAATPAEPRHLTTWCRHLIESV